MNKLRLYSLSAALISTSLPAFAQAPSTPPPPAVPPAMLSPRSPMAGGMISPEDQKVLSDAAQKAQNDPKVVQATTQMRDAMKAARAVMVAKTPTIAPLLEKIEAADSSGQGHVPLTPEERTQLSAARTAILGTPEATAWQKATVDYRAAVRDVMATDPAVAAVMARLSPIAAKAGPSPK